MKTNVTERPCEEVTVDAASRPRDFGFEFRPSKHRILTFVYHDVSQTQIDACKVP
jgi:hypothetical protein